MAKKNGKEAREEKKKGHFLLSFLIILLLIVIWLAIFATLIKLDVGGLGTMLRPMLGDVPVVNKILPDISQEELAEEKDYPYHNLPDAIDRIKELEAEVSNLKEKNDKNDDTVASLQTEIDRLKVFENNQLAFEERVKEFEENVVFAEEAPSIEEYKTYYESINPTNAEEIYNKVIRQLEYERKVQEQAEMFSKMKPAAAADVLEEMTADTESVAKILLSMKPANSGAILAQMDPTYAAKVTKRMIDLNEEMAQ